MQLWSMLIHSQCAKMMKSRHTSALNRTSAWPFLTALISSICKERFSLRFLLNMCSDGDWLYDLHTGSWKHKSKGGKKRDGNCTVKSDQDQLCIQQEIVALCYKDFLSFSF